MIKAIYGVEFLNCSDCTVPIEGTNNVMIGLATTGRPGRVSGSAAFEFASLADFNHHKVAVFEGRNRFIKPIPYVVFETGDGERFDDLDKAFEHQKEHFQKLIDKSLSEKFQDPLASISSEPEEKELPSSFEEGLAEAKKAAEEWPHTPKTPKAESPLIQPDTFTAEVIDSVKESLGKNAEPAPKVTNPTIHEQIANLVLEKPLRTKAIAAEIGKTEEETAALIEAPESLVEKREAGWVKLKEAE